MRNWFVVAAGLLAAVSWTGAEEPKASGALKEAKAKYDAWLKERQADIARVPAGDRPELEKELVELKLVEMDKLFDAAEQEAESEEAFDIFAGMLAKAVDAEKAKKARFLVVKHHLTKPHVKKVLPALAQNSDENTEGLLGIVATKNEDKECQAIAVMTLGTIAAAKSKGMSGEAKDEELKKAEDHFKKAKEKYADVKYQNSTVGKLAEARLAALKVASNLAVGKPVPDISGEDLSGATFKLRDAGKGKVVVLSFWATWCGPCMALVPHEKEMVEKNAGKPFELIGVNGDPEITDRVRATIEDKKITWRSFKNQQKDGPPLSDTWEIGGWPTIYVIDHKGIIRHSQLGGGNLDKLDKLVEDLVKEAEKK